MNGMTGRALVCDLDETLVHTNLTLESFWSAFRLAPLTCLLVLLRHGLDPTALKKKLAALSDIDVTLLPFNKEVLGLFQLSKQNGCTVCVSTSADQILAKRVLSTLHTAPKLLSQTDISSSNREIRANALAAAFGRQGFDYIGSQVNDLPVWHAAKTAYVTRPAASLTDALLANDIAAHHLGYRWKLRDLLRGLRPHQWLKNLLLFLPVIAAHRLDLQSGLAVLFGIVCFSAAASSIYIVNDLIDIEADRRHPTKKNRIFASGKVPIRIGMATSLLLGCFSLSLAANIAPAMFVTAAAYITLTLVYTIFFKRFRWADLIVLATLYTLRVIAGAVASGVALSWWLVAFVFPAFLALAAVKRITEIQRLKIEGTLPGRAYEKQDGDRLVGFACAGALATTLLFIGYTFSQAATTYYADLWLLRIMTVPMVLWFGYMIHTGRNGIQNFDPMIFALRDRISLTLLTLIFLSVGIAV